MSADLRPGSPWVPTTTPLSPTPGPLLFVQYAYPPNRRGSCGPADSQAFFEYGVSRTIDSGLFALARQFAGAWPYLELIAGALGIADPLDRRVVEAYWIGNPLLDRIGTYVIGQSMEERFRRRAGGRFANLTEGVVGGGLPHHSFHVFCVYPWIGLLTDDRKADQALTVLDRCRIRWGRVVESHGDSVVVRSRPLTWDGRRLHLGPPTAETAVCGVDNTGFVSGLVPGEWVSLHWEWVCDRLSSRQLRWLRHFTERHLAIANEQLVHDRAGRAGPVQALT